MNEKSLLAHLNKNPFVLAPMAGITDCAFRSFMREMGCGIVVTELVSAHGLHYKNEKTRLLMKFEEIQRPVGLQIFGEDPAVLAEAARIGEDMGMDFIDINFGCPVPKVVKKGGGSAALRDLHHLKCIIHSVKKAVTLPVTIKIRTGWDESQKNSLEVTHIAWEEGVTWVAIHGRTRAAGYSGFSNWDYISEVKAQSRVPVIGNGDVTTAQMAVTRLQQSGCDGVMIGRGCLKNPWIFQQAQQILQGKSLTSSLDLTQILAKLTSCYQQHYLPRMALMQIKKFSAWFSSGYPHAHQFRRQIFSLTHEDDIQQLIKDYFSSVKYVLPSDTSHEPFLRGGHG